jgi:hypothetical protein
MTFSKRLVFLANRKILGTLGKGNGFAKVPVVAKRVVGVENKSPVFCSSKP